MVVKPREVKHYICFSAILLDFIININKKYHPQVFWEECKYAEKNKKIVSTIKKELKLDNLTMILTMSLINIKDECDGLH